MSMHYDVFPQRFDFSWDFICQLKILAGKCKFHSLLSTWKMCSVQFFLEVWLVLGVIWSEFSMPVCFVPEIFSFPLSSNTLKKMSAEKAPKQETAQTPSPLPLGKTHVNRHVELIFVQDSFWKSGFLELVSLASTILHRKRWNFTVFLCRNVCSRVWCI